MDILSDLMQTKTGPSASLTDQRQHHKADWEQALKVSESRIENMSKPANLNNGDSGFEPPVNHIAESRPASTSVEHFSISGREHHSAMPARLPQTSPMRFLSQPSEPRAPAVALSAAPLVMASTSEIEIVSQSGKSLGLYPIPLNSELLRQKISVLKDEKIQLVIRDYHEPDAPLYKSGAADLRTLLLTLGIDAETIVLNGNSIYRKEKTPHAG